MRFLRGILATLFLTISGNLHGIEGQTSGTQLLKADLLNVFAHPDDETGMATTLAHYALIENKRVVNTYCTRGEGGGNMVGRQWGPSLGILRESELRACLGELGVERVYFLDQRDWAYTESAQMTMEAWDREAALERLVRIVRLTRPEVMVTMNPTPNPGQHGHHQAAGILAIEAFRLAADPTAFPVQIRDEGLEVWQAKKLYLTGSPDPYGATILSTAILDDGRNVAQVAGNALSNHRSQGFGRMADAPWLARPRTFQLLKSTVGMSAGETNLFERTDRAASQEPTSAVTGSAPLWFEGSTAVERFKQWSQIEGVASLASSLRAEHTIVAGTTGSLLLHRGPDANYSLESVEFETPVGWEVKKIPAQTSSTNLTIEVSVPADDFQSGTLVGIVNSSREEEPPIASAELLVKVVPQAESFRAETPPQISPIKLGEWQHATELGIPSTNLWQGAADGDIDASATCRVQHDDEFLFVLVEVNDDNVVRNIAPNDVRGHWRSDSVEICIDPIGGAEHTLSSFKVGIFPFTTDGRVNAARDADANQGPVSRTAPEMKLASEETSTGYRIAAAIPWRSLSQIIKPGTNIGFNVLIYDGDKKDAAIGENINECRLAWSPGRGVQGRPGYWGALRID